MGENLFALCFLLGLIGDFLHSCSESKLLDGELPNVTVHVGFEGHVLDHLLVPEQDQEHSLLFGDNSKEGQCGSEGGVLVYMLLTDG